MPDFQRLPGKFAYAGMDVHHPPDLLPPDKCSLLFNLQPDLQSGALALRPAIELLATTPAGVPIHSIVRLNDSVPGAAKPFSHFAGAGAGLYGGDGAALALLDSGFSGNPLAMVPYRPAQSPESYLYLYDSLKQLRYKTNSAAGQNIGIAAPTTEPTVARVRPLYDVLDNAVATWAGSAASGGAISAASTVARVTAATTVAAILYDIGTTGMACIVPSNAGGVYSWMLAGSMVILDAGGGSAETVVIEQAFPGNYSTTIAAVVYDAGVAGLCTIVPTIPLPGLARNMLLNINSGVYVRVLSVTAGPDGSYSFRCSTGASTVAAGHTIVAPASFRAWTTINHVAPTATLTGNSIQFTFTPTVANGSMSAIGSATPGVTNISYAGARPLQNEDYMHLSIAFDHPEWVTEVHVMLDVDLATNDFTKNYFYYVLRQGDFQLSAKGIASTIQDQFNAIASTIASQLTAKNFMGLPIPQADYPAPETPETSEPSPEQLNLGASAWLEAMFKLGDLTRVGSDQSRTLANIAKIGLLVYTSGGVVQLRFGGWWAGGGYGPDCNFNSYGNQAPPIQWRYRYRNSLTGAHSTVSPEIRDGDILRRQAVSLVCPGSADPQVDTIDLERRGGTNPDWHYVGSVPHVLTTGVVDTAGTGVSWVSGAVFDVTWPAGTQILINNVIYVIQSVTSTTALVLTTSAGIQAAVTYHAAVVAAFLDNVTESAAQIGEPLEVACYQPWPVTDTPKAGTATVTGTRVVWASGDLFNPRWLRGTSIIIGGNTYSLYAPPFSTTVLTLAENVPPPSGTFSFSIPEATIEGRPLYGCWLDEANNRICGVGDPLSPGLMYFSNNNNPDGASDAGYIEITSPSEPLLNGFYAEGSNYVFSSSSLYRVESTSGATNPYAAYRLSGLEGLAGPWAFDCQRRLLFYWGPDGVYAYNFSAVAENITSPDFYPLFPHAGQFSPGVPISIHGVTIYPPDYAQYTLLRIGYNEGYVYATYQNSVGAVEALVYSIAVKGWRKDTYTPAATLFVVEKGVPNPALMVGGQDGNLHQISTSATADVGIYPIAWDILTPCKDAGDSRANKQWGDLLLDYSTGLNVNIPGLLVSWDNLLIDGVNPAVPLSSTRTQQIYPLTTVPDLSDAPLIHRNIALALAGYGPIYLYEWQPSYLPLPEDVTTRVTDWQTGGNAHYKFVQGIRLHANTHGFTKQLQVQYDGYQIGPTITVTHDGEQTKPYSFAVPFKAHMMRLAPLDGVPWEVWPDSEWISEPEPEPANYWISQPTALGQGGYIHVREAWIPYAGPSGGIVSAIVDGATVVTIAILPASLAPVKFYVPCPPLKGKYWQLTASGTNLQIYERDCEFLVKSWGSTEPYTRVRPFGDMSGGGGASGARI